MNYAHELKMDTSPIREQLLSLNKLWPKIDTETKEKNGCITCMYDGKPINDGMMYYMPFDFVIERDCPAVKELYEMFNGSFLNKVRIMNMLPDQEIPYHLGNDSAGEGLFADEIPKFLTVNCTLNILLSPPKGDVTEFSVDTGLTKFAPNSGGKYVSHKTMWEDDSKIKVVDTHELKYNAAVINSGTWHRVKVNNTGPRILASFMFWPTITYDNVVHFCKENDLLI